MGFHSYNSDDYNARSAARSSTAKSRGISYTSAVFAHDHDIRIGAAPAKVHDTLNPLHNGLDRWQGSFRQGCFDAVAVRYAIRAVGGVDGVVVTHTDHTGCGLVPLVGSYQDRSELVYETSTEDFAQCTPEGMSAGSSLEHIHYLDLHNRIGVQTVMATNGPVSGQGEQYEMPKMQRSRAA